MKKQVSLFLVFSLLITTLSVSSCKMSKTGKGAAIGAGAGAVIGGVIGSRSGNTAAGAILGAAIGGVGGAAIGRYMDKQKRKLEEDLKKNTPTNGNPEEEVKVEREGEGIKVTLGSGILFDVSKADLKPQVRENLRKMAETLKEYKDTEILITGHTDSDGTDEFNQKLSERRANAVSNYLSSLGVSSSRLKTMGLGESQPVLENTTAQNKQKNRRVEIAIYANEELKKKAKEGKLE
ncbi:MAG: OmpA family protein [Thermoflexibacter sp.]|jgi:outer membrane protein OmpA-like peptidoglycan-associated protein|nr:OmpA family protein [Thermoflexibacter sp.]